IHLCIETQTHFIVCNLADLGRAGNVALLVVNKETGDFHHRSKHRIFPRNTLQVDNRVERFTDPESGSFVTIDRQRVRFAIHLDELHIIGEATLALGPPLVQVTRFQRGRGSLQWYGILQVVHGTLQIGGDVSPLPVGALGTYDRTAGHQRGLQNWNWIATVGTATHSTLGSQPVGIQIARDRDLAHPRVEGKKNVVWMNDQLVKIPDVSFGYDYTDPEAKETGPWQIQSPADQTDDRFDLTFTPRHHRREKRGGVLINVDFNQYYGEVSGDIVIHGERWTLQPTFAVCEESLLEL
ncbi:MAG: DUF2804 family protein, partial [Myxococcota bacterium]